MEHRSLADIHEPKLVDQLMSVSGDLKLLSGGQVENVSVPFSVFFLNI
jgi:hypothetical protein